MDSNADPFERANYFIRKAQVNRWQRSQVKRRVLRHQVGFTEQTTSRPEACRGCAHYHGVRYGQQREQRTALICGFHPAGWSGLLPCPDWQG